MDRIVIHSRVGADGVLRLNVPIGTDAADGEVEVTIEAAHTKQPTSVEQEGWRQFVLSTTGRMAGRSGATRTGRVRGTRRAAATYPLDANAWIQRLDDRVGRTCARPDTGHAQHAVRLEPGGAPGQLHAVVCGLRFRCLEARSRPACVKLLATRLEPQTRR
jgi:hypothetical protein